jgi:hypothetical protein
MNLYGIQFGYIEHSTKMVGKEVLYHETKAPTHLHRAHKILFIDLGAYLGCESNESGSS